MILHLSSRTFFYDLSKRSNIRGTIMENIDMIVNHTKNSTDYQ